MIMKEAARQILHSLLAEKGIAVPAPGEQDSEAAIRLLLERSLSAEASGALPEAVTRALTETFDAIAVAMEKTTATNDTLTQ